MKPKPYKAMISRARKICSAPLFDSFLVKTAVEHGETDPFLNQVMTAKQIEVITELRRKARILLPESAILMGVIDESGILAEDEVFVQLKRDNFRETELTFVEQVDSLPYTVEGSVLVTRNPCTHPGDIRKLKCINN
jgi:RNA-dependent RNA polymerase